MIVFTFGEEFTKNKLLYKIQSGYQSAQLIVNNTVFAKEISKIPKLTYTDDSPAKVSEKIMESINSSKNLYIPIETYFYKNSSVIGMTKGDGKIYININGLSSRSNITYLENALHELGHFPFGYGHGSNFPNGWRARMMGDFANKKLSVPYQFAQIGKQIFEKIL